MNEILIVDDEPNIRRMLASLLHAEGYDIREAVSGENGLEEVRREEPGVVLMDLYMPGGNGLDVLPRILEAAPELAVVIMSGRATLSDAVHATKLGAFHFIEKPLTPEAVLLTVRSALELRRTRELNRALRAELGAQDTMVGNSPEMESVRALISRVAPTDARVLITGESGTGKELVATAIHQLSKRSAGPLVRVNCAAIPRDLVESELFGHEKGAFTGASERRRGRFELAHGGTLFLDEIGDLGLEAQAKLLRALEAGEIERVGGSGAVPVDVRVVAASNKDLRAAAAIREFREDLLFRLLVIPIQVPPLRDRSSDIPLLVEHFLARHHARTGLRPPRLTPAALDSLIRHAWPGNVRELGNLVERVAILYPDLQVDAPQVRAILAGSGAANPLRHHPFDPQDERPLGERLDGLERSLILAALDAGDGSVAEAARQLRTDRANLYRRMRRLGIPH